MKFHKMIKKLQKDTNLVADCKSLSMHHQTLKTLGYWFCENGYEDSGESAMVYRKKTFEECLLAKDWKVRNLK